MGVRHRIEDPRHHGGRLNPAAYVEFDCELIHSGLVAQPINTLSSVAFFVAAGLVWRSSRSAAGSLLVGGVGSILFHGFPGTVSGVIHDAGVVAIAAVIVIALWRLRATPPIGGLVVLLVGIGVWFVTRTGGLLCAPESVVQGHAAWHTLAAAATVMIVSGRSARPTQHLEQ